MHPYSVFRVFEPVPANITLFRLASSLSPCCPEVSALRSCSLVGIARRVRPRVRLAGRELPLLGRLFFSLKYPSCGSR